MTDRSKTVVMLIDWDNLQICHSRDAPGTDLDLQALIALAQSYGTLVSARAYAEWNLLSERLAVYKAGIEPVFAPVMRPEGSPREGKSLADTVMVADGVDLLWTVAPDVFVLATSDKDMIPLARIAKQRGAAVVVLGSDLTAIPLVEMSNVFITYRQLLRELDRVTELEAPSGRAPARERRLRESRRPSSEPYGSPTPIGSGAGPIGSGTSGLGRSSSGIGSGPRTGGRTAMPTSTRPRVETVEPAPPRRVSAPSVEQGGPSLGERAVVAAPGPSTSLPAALEDAEGTDLTGIGASDATPRRRRRRGGRGRRPGLGAAGDGEPGTEDQATDLVEIPDDVEEPETVTTDVAPPDDLDSAVLELLAARDRESVTPPAPEAPAEPAPEAPAGPRSTTRRPATTRTGTRTPIRRRAVTTTFSDFGPPSGSTRSTSTPPPAEAPSAEPEQETAAPAASDAEPTAAAPVELAAADRPVAEDSGDTSDRPAGGAIWPPGSTDLTGPTSDTEAAPFEAALDSTPDATEAAPVAADDVSANGEADEAAKPARRRRTRRPAAPRTRKPAADAAEAPVATESGA